jgi:hypothetical protein
MEFSKLRNFFGYYNNKIYNSTTSELGYKDPQVCYIKDSLAQHYYVIIGLDLLCEVLQVRLITHSPYYDNELILKSNLIGRGAKKKFGNGDSYISKTIFYLYVKSIDIDIQNSLGKYIKQ